MGKTCLLWDSIGAGFVWAPSCASLRALCFPGFRPLRLWTRWLFVRGSSPVVRWYAFMYTSHFFHIEAPTTAFCPWQFQQPQSQTFILLVANVGFFSSPWAFLPHYLSLLSDLGGGLKKTSSVHSQAQLVPQDFGNAEQWRNGIKESLGQDWKTLGMLEPYCRLYLSTNSR